MVLLPFPPVGSHLRQLPDNTLIIQNVKREDAGTYICQAQIKGRPVFNKLHVSVVVNGQFLFQHQYINIGQYVKNITTFSK